MLRVGINARSLAKPNPTGVSRYTRNLLIALTARSDEIEYVVFGIDSLPDEIAADERPVKLADSAPIHSGPRAHYWEQFVLPRRLSRYDVDVFHTLGGQPPLLTREPLVTTIHDISPITHPEWFTRKYATLYRTLTPLAIRVSNQIITVSEFTADEVASRYPSAKKKTTSIYNGVTPPPSGGCTPDEELTSEQFLLFVGSINPRKNMDGLLSAYRRYRDRVTNPLPLVLVGPSRDVFASTGLSSKEGVHVFGFVPDKQLGWLYRNASAFVYPSLYEGFGLPILEAMSVRTPVLTSDRGAMAEVAGDAAYLADPSNPSEVATGIERIAGDDALTRDLVEAGKRRATLFTWEHTAEQTVNTYERAADQ